MSALLIFCLAAAGVECSKPASNDPLPSLSGAWRVASVKVNQRGVSAWSRDDPQLMNLALTINSHRLELKGHACTDPKLIEEQLPVAALLQETYDSSPADLGVDAAVERSSVWRLSCGSGKLGPKVGAGGWVLLIDSRTIAINWYDGALLILNRAS